MTTLDHLVVSMGLAALHGSSLWLGLLDNFVAHSKTTEACPHGATHFSYYVEYHFTTLEGQNDARPST